MMKGTTESIMYSPIVHTYLTNLETFTFAITGQQPLLNTVLLVGVGNCQFDF